jgi:hypothetical protein
MNDHFPALPRRRPIHALNLQTSLIEELLALENIAYEWCSATWKAIRRLGVFQYVSGANGQLGAPRLQSGTHIVPDYDIPYSIALLEHSHGHLMHKHNIAT